MTDLQERPVPLRQGHQVFRLIEGGGEGLFNEERDSALEELSGNRMVVGGRNSDDSGFRQLQKRPVVHKGAAAQSLGNALGLVGVEVSDTDQLDTLHSRKYARVLFTQVADSDNREP